MVCTFTKALAELIDLDKWLVFLKIPFEVT